MDDTACKAFFIQPTHTYHRQYEALRAIFVDGRSQKDVAEEFGFTHGALRQLVFKFRSGCGESTSDESPFFATSFANELLQRTPNPKNHLSPIAVNLFFPAASRCE